MQTVPATANQKAIPISQLPNIKGSEAPPQYSFLTFIEPHPAGYAINPDGKKIVYKYYVYDFLAFFESLLDYGNHNYLPRVKRIPAKD